jgi:uncharacterized protein YraI
MKLHRLLAIAAAGIGLGFSIPTLAHAYGAVTTGGVNVRVAPSASAPKITTLARGTPVDVRFCQPGWCSVSFWGGAGWVSARYLSAGVGPWPNFPQQVTPGFYFRFGTGPRRWPPPPYVNPWPDPPWWW